MCDGCVFFPLKKLLPKQNSTLISVGLASWLCLHCTDCHFSLDTVAYFFPMSFQPQPVNHNDQWMGHWGRKPHSSVLGVCEEWYPHGPNPPSAPSDLFRLLILSIAYKCLKGRHSFLALLFAGVLMEVGGGGVCAAMRSILLCSVM